MKFVPFLKEYFPENYFEGLEKKLYISRTNLENGANENISQGELIPNILASASLPLMFAPVEINGVLYADGGITNNFPAATIRPFCEQLIGVFVNPLTSKDHLELNSTLSIMDRAMHISIAQNSIPMFDLCDTLIIPEKLRKYSLLNAKQAAEIYNIGYQTALLHKEQFQKIGSLEMAINE